MTTQKPKRIRIKLRCHYPDCPGKGEYYTLLRELNGKKPRLIVRCPYCGRQAVADLAWGNGTSRLATTYRSADDQPQGEALDTFSLPDEPLLTEPVTDEDRAAAEKENAEEENDKEESA